MAGAEQTTGLGFWPKVLLWAGVIAAGALYLGSINDKVSRDERAAPLAESAAPAPSDTPASAAGGDVAPEAADVVETPADGVVPVAAEVAATPGEPAAMPAAEPVPVAAAASPVEQPAAVPVAALIPVVDTGAAVPAESADVTPEEAEAFAKAVVSEPAEPAEEPAGAAGQDEPAAGASAPAPAAAPGRAAEGSPPAAPEKMEQRRARIMAEYESMRRRAEEEMQRRWQGMGMPSPGMMPYAVYPPGYYPPAPAQPQQP